MENIPTISNALYIKLYYCKEYGSHFVIAKDFPFPLCVWAFVHNKNYNMTSVLKFSLFISILGLKKEG